VPIITQHGLWGLLVAHACQSTHNWSVEEIAAMQLGAEDLATARSIRDN
jgi:GAF domain-containing protein